jgi:prepilin-type N-terminal cleavage/methylation domain-containing protein
MPMHRRIPGFTLIELLVVIVIIGLLVSIALPMLVKAKMKAKEVQAVARFHEIQISLENFAVDHNGFYPYRVLYFSNETDTVPTQTSQVTSTGRWEPLGLIGGCSILTPNGGIDANALMTVQPRIGATLPQYFNQYSDPLVVLGYVPGGKYPENPFLKREVAFINWAWSDQVGVPATNVAVSPGDIVYTSFPVIRSDNQWHDAEGVAPNKLDKYSVTTEDGFFVGWFGLDLIDSYQMWVYGNLPITAGWYSAYDNSQYPGPPKRVVEIRQDWNGNGKKDLFEAGIIAYESGGTDAGARQQKPNSSDLNTNEGGAVEF